MIKKFHIPFKNLTPEGWLNLALTAITALYITFLGFFLINTKMCETYRVDYCAYWTSGKIMNDRGFADVYDLEILSHYQRSISYLPKNSESIMYTPVEIPYLPIFIFPFKFLSLLNILPSYLIWAVINLLVFFFYLRFFVKKMCGFTLPIKIGLMTLLLLPVYKNFYEGQLNIWLGICVGEFIRAFLMDKPLKAGFWLGGWLLKPQTLILIIPFLFLRRSIKTLTGFALASITLFGISFSLVKIDGFVNLFNIITESAEGRATSNVSAMTNWRMLGWHLTNHTSQNFGTVIITIGTILTICVALAIFKKAGTKNMTSSITELLGILAATLVVTWHSHIHMAIILIPPIIYLLMKGKFNKKPFLAWLFIPTIIQFLIYIFLAVKNLGLIPENFYPIEKLAPGLTGFILNLTLLYWAIHTYNSSNYEIINQKEHTIR